MCNFNKINKIQRKKKNKLKLEVKIKKNNLQKQINKYIISNINKYIYKSKNIYQNLIKFYLKEKR